MVHTNEELLAIAARYHALAEALSKNYNVAKEHQRQIRFFRERSRIFALSYYDSIEGEYNDSPRKVDPDNSKDPLSDAYNAVVLRNLMAHPDPLVSFYGQNCREVISHLQLQIILLKNQIACMKKPDDRP